MNTYIVYNNSMIQTITGHDVNDVIKNVVLRQANDESFNLKGLNLIQTITVEQRNILFNVAYSFNEVIKEYVPNQRVEKKQIKGLTPLEV